MNCAQARAHLGDYLEGDLATADRSDVDLHVAKCSECRLELGELRSTIALLRSLPDPEVPHNLVGLVMQRIASGENRVSGLPQRVRRIFDPRVAAPLAAGIAGLVLFATMEYDEMTQAIVAESATADATAVVDAQLASHAAQMWNQNPPTLGDRLGAQQSGRAAFEVQPRLAAIQRSQAIRFFQPQQGVQNVGFYGRTDPDPQYLDLDAHLDGALSRPEAFLRFVSQIDENDRNTMIAPLVVRAARRGDAQNVAGRLRHAQHPLARTAAEPFEQFGRRSHVVEALPASHQR